MRFDGETRHVDMNSQQGVLGYIHKWDSLYVFLDHTQEHRFQLVDTVTPGFRLKEADRPLEVLPSSEGELITFKASGPGTSRFQFQGLNPGQYVGVRTEGGPARSNRVSTLKADPSGHLTIELELGLGATVYVSDSSAEAFQRYKWDLWFSKEGRFLLLTIFLSLTGWLLCRFYQPQLKPRKQKPSEPNTALGAPGFSVEESETQTKEETNLPAGGVGPWAAGDISSTFPLDPEEDE